MLGRLGMSATEAIRAYQTFHERVFIHGKKHVGVGKFKATILEAEVKKIVRDWTGYEDLRLIDERWNDNGCPTYVKASGSAYAMKLIVLQFRVRQVCRKPLCTRLPTSHL
jgi:hypothetical protein